MIALIFVIFCSFILNCAEKSAIIKISFDGSEVIMPSTKRREDFAYVKNPRDFFSVNVPILFFDVVGFTKDTTNEAMRKCIRNIEDSMRDILFEDYNWNERNKSNQLILVPTGDGYAIAFESDMSLNKVLDLSAILYKRIISNSEKFKLRFGMAKGPCMVHQDLNERFCNFQP